MDTGHRFLATTIDWPQINLQTSGDGSYALSFLPFSTGVLLTLPQSVRVSQLNLSSPSWRPNRAAVLQICAGYQHIV